MVREGGQILMVVAMKEKKHKNERESQGGMKRKGGGRGK